MQIRELFAVDKLRACGCGGTVTAGGPGSGRHPEGGSKKYSPGPSSFFPGRHASHLETYKDHNIEIHPVSTRFGTLYQAHNSSGEPKTNVYAYNSIDRALSEEKKTIDGFYK